MELYVGMDVSLKETSICVVDDDGEIQCEGTVISEPPTIAGFIEASALHTLIRQRPPTPSCRGHSPYCGENSEPGRRIKGELDIQPLS